MKLQQLYSYTRKAIDDYHMISDGDHIAIGISGGKDSLTLLYALAGLRRFYPKPFSLAAVTVDLGFGDMDWEPVRRLCEALQVDYHVIPTRIADAVFDGRKKSLCSLCARMRKGALYDYIGRIGCSRVAYAHHMDDVVETMFLSMMYEGRFYAFPPVTEIRKDLAVIRPMIYVPEAKVIGFMRRYRLPVIENTCPADKNTRREYVKQLLQTMNRDNPGVKKQLFHAAVSAIDGWQCAHENQEKEP